MILVIKVGGLKLEASIISSFRIVVRGSLLDRVEAFGHLDVRAPGVLDERDRDAERGDLGIGTVKLDAVCFQLLCERFEVPDLEADVIDGAARGAHIRRRRRREVECYAGLWILGECGAW